MHLYSFSSAPETHLCGFYTLFRMGPLWSSVLQQLLKRSSVGTAKYKVLFGGSEREAIEMFWSWLFVVWKLNASEFNLQTLLYALLRWMTHHMLFPFRFIPSDIWKFFHTLATSATKRLLCGQTLQSTWQSIRRSMSLSAAIVTRLFIATMPWRSTSCSTRSRKHMSACTATRNFCTSLIWRCMSWSTRANGRTAVASVAGASASRQTFVGTCRHTWKRTDTSLPNHRFRYPVRTLCWARNKNCHLFCESSISVIWSIQRVSTV